MRNVVTGEPLLEMRGIRKGFNGVPVLHGVDLTLKPGEVLALLGENGAGKSTLMKILGGDYVRDGGDVLIEGQPAILHSPRDAERAGVRIIYQELNYAPDLSVAENILLGHLPRKKGPLGAWLVDWPAAYRRAEELLGGLKAGIDPRQKMGDLSVGKQQLVEIAKALSGDARLLVMDEPTAALTAQEVKSLFETITALRTRGVGIIYISHRLDEVEAIADRVLVLRDGAVAGDRPIADMSRTEMIRLMVGREIEAQKPISKEVTGAPVLEVAGLQRSGVFEDISLTVHAGEVVGLYGLLGAGQFEVVRALFGAEPATAGEIKVQGQHVRVTSPRVARRCGIGFVPEDRKREGLVLGMSSSENLTLGNWSSVSRGGVLSKNRELGCADLWTNQLGIRSKGGAKQAVSTFSGGNQQKVVLARWLEAGVRVLLLAEPTRGVDVGARTDIYQVLEGLCKEGVGLIVVSTDMEEMLALCDRILVFSRGSVTATYNRAQANQEVLLAAAGGSER